MRQFGCWLFNQVVTDELISMKFGLLIQCKRRPRQRVFLYVFFSQNSYGNGVSRGLERGGDVNGLLVAKLQKP